MRSALFVLLFFTAAAKADNGKIEKRMDYLFGAYVAYVDLFHDLQGSVTSGDHQTTATLMSYPLTLIRKTGKTKVKDPIEFLAKYDQIITKDIETAILNQKFEALHVDYNGVMIGRGQVWYTGICKDNECKKVDVKVITINQEAPK